MASKLFGNLPEPISATGKPREMVGTPVAAAAPMPAMAVPNGQPPASKLLGTTPAPQSMPSVDDLLKGLHQTAYLHARFKAILEAGKLPTRKTILDLSSDLMNRHILSAQRLASELASLPDEPVDIEKWVRAHYATTNRQIDQLTMMLHGAADPRHPLNAGRASPMPSANPPMAVQ